MRQLDSIVRQRVFSVNGIELFGVEAGPEDGPLVILLHGFPEFWYGWRHQIGPLAAAGYRVLVPDQRGYNISDKPRKLREYRADVLARDVVGLIDDTDRDRAHVIGHDWGAAVAWMVALRHPERVDRLAILNVPHPRVMRKALLHDRAQRKRSRYIFWFQLPGLPERLLSRRGYAKLAAALQKTSRANTFTQDDLKRYREAWSSAGALTGMLNWYRALRYPVRNLANRVTAPTLMIWGIRDRFLGREMVQPSIDQCDEGRVELIEEATHWVQHEEPERVNELLLAHLAVEASTTGR